MGRTRLTTEEIRNSKTINALIENTVNVETLSFTIMPYGCHIEILCNNVLTLGTIENLMNDCYAEHKLDDIRGDVRVTYNNFIKE